MNLKIKYGLIDNNIDVTRVAFEKCLYNNILFIPKGYYMRDQLFTDPLKGVMKSIFIEQDGHITEYDSSKQIYINFHYEIYDQYTVPKNVLTKYEDVHQYTAIIVEPREHRSLLFVLNNFLENLSNKWHIIVFHGNQNGGFVQDMITRELNQYTNRIQLVHLPIDNLTSYEYSSIIKSAYIYDYIKTEHFLIFQNDTLILKEHKDLINDFLQYDYVGAPWKMDHCVGNGGLSLRRKSKMLEIINKNSNPRVDIHEDIYFSYCNNVDLFKPDFETAKRFSQETVFNEVSFGVHKPWQYLEPNEWDYLTNRYPELKTLKQLNMSA